MLRIHFTAEDLSRVRMAPSLGAVAESLFALDLFSHSSGVVLNRWRRQVRKRLGTRTGAIERLVRDHEPLPDLLWLLEHPMATGSRAWITDRDRQRVAADVYMFCQAAIIPYWEQISEHLEAVRDARGRIAITNGVDRMLGTLHPKVRWNAPVLEIPHPRAHDLHLDGRGLVLSPSLFLLSRPCLAIDTEAESGMPALVFSAPVGVSIATQLLGDVEAPRGPALGALIGHTRAAALRALAESCTTGELSERLGISLAGASKHATVLRHAGLITTERNRNTALHTLTPLGLALLRTRHASAQAATRADYAVVGQAAKEPA
jgi:DNA-binding transcriptional ArsR family regulator